MRSFRFIAYVLGCAAFMAPSVGAASDPLVARVVSINGEATLDKKPLHPGDSIHFGEKIEVASGGGVKLLTVLDRSVFDFTESAVATLSKGDHVETAGLIVLQQGRLRFAVHPRFTWAAQAMGIRLTLNNVLGAMSAKSQQGEGMLVAATEEGASEVKQGDRKVTTLNEIDRILLRGKLSGENLPDGIKAKRETAGSAEVRDWVAGSVVEDFAFRQSLQLGAGETARARGATYQFLTPDAELPKSKRPPVAFDDPEHRFSSRPPLYELNGSAQQVRQQANFSH